jgi:hypothetical protein
MARTINSPGVQITETDLTFNTQIAGGTSIFAMGFAPQGPTDEIISITSISELEQVYGVPETPAERYFYYSCREILNSPSTLFTTRLPYGSGAGTGFTDAKYCATFYPVASGESGFTIGEPQFVELDEQEYNDIRSNNVTWSVLPSSLDSVTSLTFSNKQISKDAGIIILNTAQTTINDQLEGYYLAITDNSSFGPGSQYNSVQSVKSVTRSSAASYTSIPSTRFSFFLSGDGGTTTPDSVSEIIESIPTYDFGQEYFNDCVIVSLFKLRTSIYEPQALAISISEAHIGSFDSKKETVANVGGIQRSFYLENIINNNSNNVKMLIHPYISRITQWTSTASENPSKTVRMDTNAKSLYSTGVFANPYDDTSKYVGDVYRKIERGLSLVESPEILDIDLIIDAGLTTIAATTSAGSYTDNQFFTRETLDSTTSNIAQGWLKTFKLFNNHVQNVRKDCMFIGDPLRYIFIQGEDTKVIEQKTKNFTNDIFNPLKKHFSTVNSNYAATYGNWVKVYDPYGDKNCWIPSSGYIGAVYARNDAVAQPWFAPAGLNRGIMGNIIDLGFNPNQKQRDSLYTISINPVVYFTADGHTVYGQKTLQSKPSAFDRVNVRRLFLTLEKSTLRALRYFVFEPNTIFTRTRLRNTLIPIFELAKNTEGLYDYLIVCDERNNSPSTIDANELRVDIYLKPVRAAEFILVNFIATRTGQSFEELIQ